MRSFLFSSGSKIEGTGMIFRRKKTGEPEGLSEVWLISYADMITGLLVMFVALTTLGLDQTGISLANAVGSFLESQRRFGLPSFSPPSSRAVKLPHFNPHYPNRNPDKNTINKGTGAGPDLGGDDAGRVLQMDEEKFKKFLGEMKRVTQYDPQPTAKNRATIDFYVPLKRGQPYLKAEHSKMVAQIVPLLRRQNYRVYIVRWAASPTDTAWIPAAEQAKQIVDEIADEAQLDSESRSRLIPLGQPWWYPNVARPEFSFVITTVEPPAP